MRLASGLLFALLLVGQGGAGSAPEEADPVQVAEFIAAPGARTGCLKLDVPEATGVACFDVQVATGADPTTDHFTWRLSARVTATEGRQLQRVKIRLAGGGRRSPHGNPGVAETSTVARSPPASPAPLHPPAFSPPPAG